MSLSILMSVYKEDNASFLNEALVSIFHQSLPPNEVIIVKDGPLTGELNELVNLFQIKYPKTIKIVALPNNVGLGNALRLGLKHCTNEFVARMDSDDISIFDRFRTQMDFLLSNPGISALGSTVEEFAEVAGDLKRYRKAPVGEKKIKKYSKYRNPLNHPSVMFRRSDVIVSGSYIDIPLFEDYFLWVRMLLNGFLLENIDVPLLYFRVGNGMVGRRHGWDYMKKEVVFLSKISKLGFLNKKEYILSIILKLPVRLMPKKILEFIYSCFLRKK